MAMNGISGYNSLMDYQSWVDSANTQTESVKNRVGASSSTGSTNKSTGSTSSADTSSSSVFLMNYQMALTDLESASARLQTSQKDNVFSNYESALNNLSKAVTDEEREEAQAAVGKARDDIKSALTDFADKYNKAVSFLESNRGRSDTVSDQLAAMKRTLPTSGALKTVGMKLDVYGKLQIDEKELDKALDETYAHVKETVGGQYGIAERTGDRASTILDSPVSRILGSGSSAGSADSTEKTGSSSGSSSSSSKSNANNYSMPDSLTSFYNFSRAGAFNLSNYYAVGMLLNTVG